MIENKFYFVSLGCAKNTVDSESMAKILHKAGYSGVTDPSTAEFLIVNTCGFLQAARKEAVDILNDLSVNKQPGQYLIAAGCLTERYRQDILKEIPQVDGIMSTRRWMDILKVVKSLKKRKQNTPFSYFPESPTVGKDEKGIGRFALQNPSAYLKIADGCRRSCAFCTIPSIKGPLVSRTKEKILHEAKILQEIGIKEIILVAQDTTDYGSDLGVKNGLAKLLKEITSVAPEIPWLRILYTYPGIITDELINVMAEYEQVLPYIDIPLQHASPTILKAMNRPSNLSSVKETLNRLREAMPEIALRSTFITGFPGESEQDFQQLVEFIEEIQFDRVGVFPYSFEPGAPGEHLGDPIPQKIKSERVEQIMTLQEKISLKINQSFIGKPIKVLVEGITQEGITFGRTYRDAPEIDGLVLIEKEVPVGEFAEIMITGVMPHDLIGVRVNNNLS
ncbi:MAG: 30S ribosomal protein S12 methylthiotransferase RimO [Anaerolineaceae bacterium]|nr:30S ribosomal protein S12 methylthiotransferase RimO [Anaerolineaceae bacterium]